MVYNVGQLRGDRMANKRSIPRVCQTCSEPFLASKWEVSKGAGKFCSVTCTNASFVRPIEDRFWAKVNKDGPVIRTDLGPCWVWTAGVNDTGYGIIWYQGNNVRASRVSWELAFGGIQDGLWALHKCDNPPCVRPDHLFLGTVTDNVQDCVSKQRHRSTTHPETIRRGSQLRAAKWTEAQVAEMKRRVRAGERIVDVARAFNINPAKLSNMMSGRIWPHVP